MVILTEPIFADSRKSVRRFINSKSLEESRIVRLPGTSMTSHLSQLVLRGVVNGPPNACTAKRISAMPPAALCWLKSWHLRSVHSVLLGIKSCRNSGLCRLCSIIYEESFFLCLELWIRHSPQMGQPVSCNAYWSRKICSASFLRYFAWKWLAQQ